ncbi:hypothetical protein GGF38_001274, partial [Coemansia sp. RSA 25]
RKEWTKQVKRAFSLNSREVKYIFAELEHYATLMAKGCDGEEPGAIDMLWINRGDRDGELAKEFARNAALLEAECARNPMDVAEEDHKPAERQVLVDPFLYAFAAGESLVFKKPITSPVAAVSAELPRIKPGAYGKWGRAIDIHNSNNRPYMKTAFDKREIRGLTKTFGESVTDWDASCWLPTDFDVSEDGSVTIRSYINNLHPVRYADLYHTISKVFAKFVPLLEQVATDAIHPRLSRDVFYKRMDFKAGTLHPHDILEMVQQGQPLPDELQKFVTTSDSYCYGRKWNDTLVVNGVELDTSALFDEWAKATPNAKASSALAFSPLYRPTKPYSMRGLPLQASVEVATINLTPDNPIRMEGEWRAVCRENEGIFAAGYYFYDVENIANARLMFQDHAAKKAPSKPQHKPRFYADSMAGYNKQCSDMKAIGGAEIKTGRFICYPTEYQMKMSSIQLADPTKAGHIKYIAFYIVDPSSRQVSTEIVPPRQPGWANTGLEVADVAGGICNPDISDECALAALKKVLLHVASKAA